MTTYASVLTALSDPTRRDVLERLRQGPRSVTALAESLPVSRPAVSQHLKVLREAGLVTQEQAGTRHFYSVNPGGLVELRKYLDGFWSDVLLAFEAEVNSRKDDPT
ncbi:MAG: metalloregulator ArsR/SmtB family transcription factor [Gemmatimonadota bacterium]